MLTDIRKVLVTGMKDYLPTDERVLVLGRTVMRNPLPLFWTASGMELRTNSSDSSER